MQRKTWLRVVCKAGRKRKPLGSLGFSGGGFEGIWTKRTWRVRTGKQQGKETQKRRQKDCGAAGDVVEGTSNQNLVGTANYKIMQHKVNKQPNNYEGGIGTRIRYTQRTERSKPVGEGQRTETLFLKGTHKRGEQKLKKNRKRRLHLT